MESDNDFRLVSTGSAPDIPPLETSAEASEDIADDVHTNGVAAADGSEAVAAGGDAADAGVSGGDEPMELDEPLNSSVQSLGDSCSAYIGDNCISTPGHTETNSPQQEAEPDSEGLQNEGAEAEEYPDQSVSSAGASGMAALSAEGEDDGSLEESDMSLPAAVASSDNTTDQVCTGSMDALQTTGISSSTAESGVSESTGNPAISSSDALACDLLPSTSSLTDGGAAAALALNHLAQGNTLQTLQDVAAAIVDGHPDTSAAQLTELMLQDASIPVHQVSRFALGEHTAVSSSNANIGLLHQQVSSTCTDMAGADESAVSSSMNSNGNTPMGNSVGARDAADALATLASAALNRQHSTSELKPEKDEDPWYTVGIVKGTTFTVHNYISDPNIDLSKLSIDNLPDFSHLPTTPLEPGTGYKFRVAAINSCGKGEFGEESAFKTCVPGFPGAPSDIKISKSAEGAHLSWEPPQASPEGIFEYSVYLAVRPPKEPPGAQKPQLTFIRVYCGKLTTCVVPQSSLGNALIDSSTKPAIIFRIAARNEKGYGPATQVRWLQENKMAGVKRIMGDGRPPGTPPKQQKQMLH